MIRNDHASSFLQLLQNLLPFAIERQGSLACGRNAVRHGQKFEPIYTTLSGGSLGSCVDEERSQLRELM